VKNVNVVDPDQLNRVAGLVINDEIIPHDSGASLNPNEVREDCPAQ
jgi:hypothetical protein